MPEVQVEDIVEEKQEEIVSMPIFAELDGLDMDEPLGEDDIVTEQPQVDSNELPNDQEEEVKIEAENKAPAEVLVFDELEGFDEEELERIEAKIRKFMSLGDDVELEFSTDTPLQQFSKSGRKGTVFNIKPTPLLRCLHAPMESVVLTLATNG